MQIYQTRNLYETKRLVHITEKGPEEDFFYLEITSLESYIASSVLPQEEGVGRFRYKDDKETSLPIFPSGSYEITLS